MQIEKIVIILVVIGRPSQIAVVLNCFRDERERAKDQKLIKRALLYQLSYAPTLLKTLLYQVLVLRLSMKLFRATAL